MGAVAALPLLFGANVRVVLMKPSRDVLLALITALAIAFSCVAIGLDEILCVIGCM